MRICFRRCLFVCLSDCLFFCPFVSNGMRKTFRTDFHEIFREDWQWASEQLIKFCWRSGCRNNVLDGGPAVLRDIAMATNFGTQFLITGFVGYSFGCVIASNTLFDSRGGFQGSSYLMKI